MPPRPFTRLSAAPFPALLPVLLLALFVASLPGCGRNGQKTPEAVISTARELVREGRAEDLTTLIYAPDDRSRTIIKAFGAVLGHMQDVAVSVERRFPEDVAGLRARAEAAAQSGQASSMLERVLTSARLGPTRGAGGEDPRKVFEQVMQEFFADPYGWIERSEGRLGAQVLTDDLAMLTWDEKPILPPVGLTLKKEKGKWYLYLPTDLLRGVGDVLPKTDDEVRIWTRLIKAMDNVLVDLKKDLDGGRILSINHLAEEAGEKAFIPVALVMLAYGKAVEEREKLEREARSNASEGKNPSGAEPGDASSAADSEPAEVRVDRPQIDDAPADPPNGGG